jgi:exodeoxyribonuclease VII large subunit
VSVYEGRGDLQLVVEALQAAGEGVWYEKFLQLKRELAVLGFFDEARKRPLVPMPRAIGVVTSLGAAALHDVVTALQRRVPHIPVVIAPAQVQGVGAAPSLIAALQAIQQIDNVDVVLMVRGGGSLEDLWAFNDRHLAQAVVQSRVPVVSGVGHETDITIVDLCADLRAPTPTAAAELCAPSRQVGLDALEHMAQSLTDQLQTVLDAQAQALDWVQSRLGRPSALVAAHRVGAAHLQQRMQQALSKRIQMLGQQTGLAQTALMRVVQSDGARKRQAQDQLAWRLHNLDPRLVLQRGYAWLTDEQNKPITSVHQLSPQQDLTVSLSDGEAGVRVLGLKAS